MAENIFEAIIIGFFLLLFVSIIGGVAFGINCGGVISERDTCCANSNAWQEYAVSLNDSINNCSNLIQNQIDICDERITSATDECNTTLVQYQAFVVFNRYFYVTYIISFTIYLFLSINLFKIVVDIGLKEEWKKAIFKLKKTWLILKILFWAILTFGLVVGFILLMSFNPI